MTANAERVPEYAQTVTQLDDTLNQLRGQGQVLRQRIAEAGDIFSTSKIISTVEQLRAGAKANPTKAAVLDSVLTRLRDIGDDPVLIAELRSVNVNELLGDALQNGSLSKAGAARALTDVKKAIDAQLGDKFVNAYLAPYSRAFDEKNIMALNNRLRSLYETNPAEFRDFMRGNRMDLLDDFGINAKTVKDALGSATYKEFNKIADNIGAKATMGEQAAAGAPKANEIIEQNEKFFRFPNILRREIATANKALEVMESHLNKKTIATLSKAYQSGEDISNLLRLIPYNERNAVAKWIAAGGLKANVAGAGATVDY
jgi:hypothetical protein